MIDTIELPVENITSCTFGGNKLQTLYITSARWGMTKEQIEKNPQAGGVFAIDLDIQGIPDNSFNG